MRQFSYWKAIYLSFYSRKLYQDVARNWSTGTLLYLLFVLSISWTVMIFSIQSSVNVSAEHMVNKLVPQFPEISIEDGEASTPLSKPYIVKDPETQDILAVIDTRGNYKELHEINSPLLLTKSEIIYKDKHNLIKIQKIPANLKLDIDPEVVKRKVIHFAGFAWLLMLPILIGVSYVYRFLQMIMYAILGKLYAAIIGVPLRLVEIFKLSAVFITPAIVISTILDFMDLTFHYQWLLYFLVSMGYMMFAIRANKP